MYRFFDRLNLTPAERRLVVAIIAVVFVVVNYWLVWPRFGDFDVIQQDIAGKEKKMRETFQREIDRRPTYEATLRNLQTQGSVVPQGEERIAFRSDMERLVRDVGLMVPRWGEVVTERAAGVSSNAFFDAISLQMAQVAGSEAQFVDFLYRVGASNSTIRVKDLTLAPGPLDPRTQGKTNLNATIRLVASIQRPTARLAPESTNAPAPGPPGKGSNAAPVRIITPGNTNTAGPAPGRTNAFTFPTRPANLTRTNAPVSGARTNTPAVPAPGVARRSGG